MIDVETKNFLHAMNCEITPCGSRVTCDPPPMNTDEDFLVFSPTYYYHEMVDELTRLGWSWEGVDANYQFKINDGFASFRKGPVNLIISASHDFIKRHKAATFVCKRLNLMSKESRISLFQAVLYGEMWPPK